MAEPIGLIPAAGLAQRLEQLPCSKELLRVGPSVGSDLPLEPVSARLLRKMASAGVRCVYCVIRGGKWDIPAYFGDGHVLGLHIAYLMRRLPYGVPYTLDGAYPFVRDRRVVFGFPDVLVTPEDVFVRLLDRHAAIGADIVLGLFPAGLPDRMDMVDASPDGRVRAVIPRPASEPRPHTWMVAVWAPAFTEFMHDHVARRLQSIADAVPGAELALGSVIQAGLAHGLHVDSVAFEDGRCLDIGIPDNLARVTRDAIECTPGRS
jgi:glucose-1-phosphate thymidylyltransferase